MSNNVLTQLIPRWLHTDKVPVVNNLLSSSRTQGVRAILGDGPVMVGSQQANQPSNAQLHINYTKGDKQYQY